MNLPVDRTKLKVCQFGEKCYRLNPIHFAEFSHKHLDTIYDNALNSEYKIPVELNVETIKNQLKLLEKLFPKALSDGPDKAQDSLKCKMNDGATCSNRAASTNDSNTDGDSRLAKKPKLTRNIKDYIPVVLEKGRMAAKLERAAPYYMFLTAITDSKMTHSEPLTVTMQELLDASLGDIECSVQINFMVDIGWLLGHYYFAGILQTPLLVLHGDETPELRTIGQTHPNVTAIKVNIPTPFSTSHSKIMLLGYKDGSMRIVISTANLYEDDWHNRTQGLWISPLLLPLADGVDTAAGESPTNFKQDFMLYLVEYKIAQLQPWIARMRRCDFSPINVFFIGSVPGGHREGPRGQPWGHGRVASLLQKHCARIDDKVSVICQSSSIGSLGANVQGWVQHDLLNSLRRDSQPLGVRQFPAFKMIYPSYGNVSESHDGLLGGGCLPYSRNTDTKQPWLLAHLYQWKSQARHRTHAMPHIKSYTRLNQEERCIYWFMLTSANLSRAAWGGYNKVVKVQPCLRISNYEAGVLFLPGFVTGEDTFPLGHERDDVPAFPLPYDMPLTPYGPNDRPFLMDYLM